MRSFRPFSTQNANDGVEAVILTIEKKSAIFRYRDYFDAISISAFDEANRLAEARRKRFQSKQKMNNSGICR
jgi:hypothetical protein